MAHYYLAPWTCKRLRKQKDNGKGRGQVLQLSRTVKLEPGSEGMPRNKENKNLAAEGNAARHSAVSSYVFGSHVPTFLGPGCQPLFNINIFHS